MAETLKLKNLRVVYLPEWRGEDPAYPYMYFGLSEHSLSIDVFPAETRDKVIKFVSRVAQARRDLLDQLEGPPDQP